MTWNKKHSSKQVISLHFKQSIKTCSIFRSVSFLWISIAENTMTNKVVKSKFSFLYVDI